MFGFNDNNIDDYNAGSRCYHIPMPEDYIIFSTVPSSLLIALVYHGSTYLLSS